MHFRVRNCCNRFLVQTRVCASWEVGGGKKRNEVLDSGDSCVSLPVEVKRVVAWRMFGLRHHVAFHALSSLWRWSVCRRVAA